jgi:cell division protein ZapA
MTEGRAEIEILGQRITIRGRGSPEYIRDLAQYLDGKIRTVREQAQVTEPTRLSVLAGLHVVDELFRSREREASLAAQVDSLVERLGRALEG